MAVVRRELQHTHLALPAVGAPQRIRRGSGRLLSALSSLIVVGLAVWLAYTLIGDGVAWATQKVDDLRYGYPRTVQTDGYVGYGETAGQPTHVVAVNLHGQISILVVNGSDPTRVRVLRGPTLLGDGPDLVAPLVRLADVNHDGAADLILRVNDQDITYLNVPARHTFQLARSAPGPVNASLSTRGG